MNWCVTFETSEVLGKDGVSLVPFLDDAMIFSSQENCFDYIAKNRDALLNLGSNPLPSKLKG